MGIQLRESGERDFVILEKADRVGGTWRENSYPGVACDVPSHLYSFSFELNPNWTRVYFSGAEIQAYREHCAEKYGLGYNSIILMIEAQVRYVLGCLALMRRRSSKTLDPLPESARRFN